MCWFVQENYCLFKSEGCKEESSPMNREQVILMKLKGTSGKEQIPLFKGKLHCGVYLPLFSISQDRVERSIKTKPQQAVMKFQHTFIFWDSNDTVMKLTSNI